MSIGPEQRRDQISHVPNIITVWLFYVIRPIHMLLYVLPAHVHPLMNKTSYYLETDKSGGSYL